MGEKTKLREKFKIKPIPLLVSVLVFVIALLIYGHFTYEPSSARKLRSVTKPTVDISVDIDDKIKYVGDGIRITGYTESVIRGETASVSVTSLQGRSISISVYYPSGKSESAVFDEKHITPNEVATWEWKVPERTTAESLRVVVRSGGVFAEFYIIVK